MVNLATFLNTILIVLVVLLGLVILFIIVMIFWWIISYNKLVKLRNKVQSSWTQIEVQLKKRFELIPDLIKIINDYSKNDSTLKQELNELNKSFLSLKKMISIKEMSSINDQFNSIIKKFITINSEVMGDSHFNDINKVIVDTNNKIEFSQRFYNDSASLYNNKRRVFPYSFVARIRKFDEAELFDIK